MAILLIEGVDKVGKTTLINDLKQLFPSAKVYKNNIKPEDKRETTIGRTTGIYLGFYQIAIANPEEVIIFDRSHITELIYAYRRGYNPLTYFNWFNYEKKVLLGSTVIIYLSAPIQVITRRFKEDNETYISKEEIQPIVSGYELYLRKTSLPKIKLSSLDLRSDNIKKVFNGLEVLHKYGQLKNKP